jgi:serine/threonine protein kinase/Flp pilus assembly protein TadD
MQSPARQISTCPTCGAALEETFDGGGGCMFCLLQAGIGSEEETVHDSTSDAVQGGVRFGVYEIDCHADGNLCELGRGAMGVTYRATDPSLRRKVALKIIKTDIAERSADARERFVREARAAAALRHEHIATVYQFGMRLETGQYFYAMELVEGETLDERIRRVGPLDARSTIGIAQQVTSALAAAEKHGLVHRDLKPANLMLVKEDAEVIVSDQPRSKRNRLRALRKSGIPVVKIIDFGLAKAFHTAADPKSLTHDRFVGTPAFASPEQFAPKAFGAALDVRSDIYSLGETLWFALTGKAPFAGRTLPEIHRAQKSNALPVEQLKAAHVPHRLKSLLGSMLAFEPASRPSTGELAARLQRCSAEARSVRRTRAALSIAALVVLSASAVSVFRPQWIRNAASNPVPDKSIAVLPFENLSDEKQNAYFTDGVQDEILSDLAKIADLKVISRTSVMQYRNTARNLRKIAQQLGVSNILEGSVQRVANHVRVNAQLIDARNDTHLWGQTYDRDLADVFAIQSEIAKAIADQLEAKLTRDEIRVINARPTAKADAYLTYLQAQDKLRRTQSSADLEAAIKLYKDAIQLDPMFALAFARLATAEGTLYQATNQSAVLVQAKAAASEALRLQPDLPEAHLALGFLYYRGERDYDRALAELEIAKAGLPNDAEIFLVIGSIERRQGKWRQSTAHLEKATTLNPNDPFLWMNLAINYQALRDFSKAVKAFDQGSKVDRNFFLNRYFRARFDIDFKGDTSTLQQLLASIPKNPDPDGRIALARFELEILQRRYKEALQAIRDTTVDEFHGFWPGGTVFPKAFLLGQVYRLLNEPTNARASFQEAKRVMESAVSNHPLDASRHAILGEVYASLGLKDEAILEGKRATELLPESEDALDGPALSLAFARIYTIVGDSDSAIGLLTHARSLPRGITSFALRLDPAWDSLRNNSRFEKLLDTNRR